MFGVLRPKVSHLVCHLPEHTTVISGMVLLDDGGLHHVIKGLLHCSHRALCEAIPELGASMNELPGRLLLCCLAPSLHECPYLC